MDEPWPQTLTWAEVDPDRVPFDADGIEAAVRPLIPATKAAAEVWEEAITDALVERYGRWACGWRWVSGEEGIGGGPVHGWCAQRRSLTTPQATAACVKAALVEWRAWIERLAARFVELAPRGTEANEISRAFEHAVTLLVADVVEQTMAEDAWYTHCAQVLGWYLERWGVAAARADELVDAAIGGRFESWIAPNEAVVQDVARTLAGEASPCPR